MMTSAVRLQSRVIGSGSAAILETALLLANSHPENTLRFAFWAGEEQGLLGSADYVAGLSQEELDRIALYMNYDMVASPNYIFGVYDADGSVRGELAYVLGHLIGTRSCALCDISHGRLRRRTSFDEAIARLGVPFDLVHRDERPTDLVDIEEPLPYVVARVGEATVVLLGRDDLVACSGDPEIFVTRIRSSIADAGLRIDQ